MSIFDGKISQAITSVSIHWLLEESGIVSSVDETEKKIVFEPVGNLQFLQCCACDRNASKAPTPEDPSPKSYSDYTVEVIGSFSSRDQTDPNFIFLANRGFIINVDKITGDLTYVDVYARYLINNSASQITSHDLSSLDIQDCILYHIGSGNIMSRGYFEDYDLRLKCVEMPGCVIDEIEGEPASSIISTGSYEASGPVIPETVCFTMYYGELDSEDEFIPIPGIGLNSTSFIDIPISGTIGSEHPTGDLVIKNLYTNSSTRTVVGSIDYLTGTMTWNPSLMPLPSGYELAGVISTYCGSRQSGDEQYRSVEIDKTQTNKDPTKWCIFPSLGSVKPGTFTYYPNGTSGTAITDRFIGVTDKGERYGDLYNGNLYVGEIKYDYGFQCNIAPENNIFIITYYSMSLDRQFDRNTRIGASMYNSLLYVDFIYKDLFSSSGTSAFADGTDGHLTKCDIISRNVYYPPGSTLIGNCSNCFFYFTLLTTRELSFLVPDITINRCDNINVCIESDNGPGVVVFTNNSYNILMNTERIKYLYALNDVYDKVTLQVDGETVPGDTTMYEYIPTESAKYSVTSRLIPASDEQMRSRNYLYNNNFF